MISFSIFRALKEFELEDGLSIVDTMHRLEDDISKVHWAKSRMS